MYNVYNPYPCPYYFMRSAHYPYNVCHTPPYPYYVNPPIYNARFDPFHSIKDYGSEPFVIDIEEATVENDTFRTALWTGDKLQVTLMSIDVGEDIGLETHPNTDQFIRIEEGQGIVKIGDEKDKLSFIRRISDDDAIMIPAGKWHNIINSGDTPLKLYSIYAPPEHPYGTIHKTKAIAEKAEKGDKY